MKKYRIVERNSNFNDRITILRDEIESYEEAKKELEKIFLMSFNESDTPEDFEKYILFKLENGKVINYEDFSELEEVENYEIIFTGDDRWEEDGRYYYIEEEE